jgi:hypothetical protein
LIKHICSTSTRGARAYTDLLQCEFSSH